MPLFRHPLLLSLCLAFCHPTVRAADAPASKDMQIVQRIDNVLVGVDAVSLEILGRRHVAGSYFLINLRRPSPVAGYAEFVADCQVPLRLATLSSTLPSASLQPEPPPLQQRRATALDLEALRFDPVHMLDGTWLVAEFACRSSSQPGSAGKIARQLREKGGPPDMLSVFCDLQADGSNATRRGVEVRYSAQDDAVAVNHQWLSSGFVSDTEVVFGTGAQWIVDRQAKRARLLASSGALLFEGKCDSRAP